MKKIIVSLIVIVLVAVALVLIFVKDEKVEPIIKTPEAIAMCYQYSKTTSRGFVDRAWLQMNILGENVTGEYQNLPAEKDSKIGAFSGTVGPMDPKISGRVADVWWNSLAEGMQTTEQLNIQFGEGSAVVLFGEMTDRGDGTYIYKDATKLTPGFQMSQTDCESLQEMLVVEKYIRDNLETIVPKEPKMNDAWYYATVLNINSLTKTGTMLITYENGQLQKEINFSYSKNGSEIKINLK
ncbi:MAG: hypothetical protein WC822_01850 [Candidatus Paceibacterota bacterium]|jgi:hypothetical protein